MRIENKNYHTIWLEKASDTVYVIDQRRLPHKFEIMPLRDVDDVTHAIQNMVVRGAPLIGVTASYGIYLAIKHYSILNGNFNEYMATVANELKAARPTAVNLAWAVNRMLEAIEKVEDIAEKLDMARDTALNIESEDIANCEDIGRHGAEIIQAIYAQTRDTVNILTHCNAGWLAAVDRGTALAPVYKARDMGIPVHVWVDETRPRNQGAALTAFELLHEGISHTLIADNTGGHLMQNGMVDMVITGADRMAKNGDVANKIGTYLKALAAHDNNIPFYVALPTSTIDNAIASGKDIPIEERGGSEVLCVSGINKSGMLQEVCIAPNGTPAANYGFDITPARLITGIITERGIIMKKKS